MNLTHIRGNTYVLEGKGLMTLYQPRPHQCILIDSGEISEYEDLVDTLHQAALTPIGVLSTHVHLDHSINNAALREQFGTQVAVPAGEVQLCHSILGLKGYLYPYSPEMINTHQGAMVCQVDCPIPYEDGSFHFCDVPFHILHTPGHSLDHVCITTPDGVCCVGDAVFSNQGLTGKLPYGLALGPMMHAAQKLRNTNHSSYVVAHRGVHSQIQPLVDATCTLIRRRAQEIRHLVDAPITITQLWQRLNDYHALFSRRVEQASLMERNLRNFVELLVDEGQLQFMAQEGMLYIAPKEDI